MADTFVKRPNLVVGTTEQLNAQMGENDIGFATDVSFYNTTEVDSLLADKQPVGDYATNSALASGLALKVAIAQGAENAGKILKIDDSGNVIVADESGGASLPILMPVWSDHVINNMSWLRADTFSWQSGDVNKAAYEHLAEDAAGVEVLYAFRGSGNPTIGDNIAVSTVYAKTETVSVGSTVYLDANMSVSSTVASVSGNTITSIASVSGYDFPFSDGYVRNSAYDYMSGFKTDTIGDITITYYQAQDGHKICLPDQESNISEMYETTGAADYYILDSTNKQFKLPRNYQPKRTLIRTANNADGTWYKLYSDGWVEQGGYDSTNFNSRTWTYPIAMSDTNYTLTLSVGYVNIDTQNGKFGITSRTETGFSYKVISLGGNAVGDNMSWRVEGYSAVQGGGVQRKYEYYYVGKFEQSAIEQTAGINAELFNGKADSDLRNIPANYDYVVDSQLPTADNGYTWYRKYKSGWVEQGGAITSSSGTGTIILPIEMLNGEYEILAGAKNANLTSDSVLGFKVNNITTTGFSFRKTYNSGSDKGVASEPFYWHVIGLAT